MCRRGQHIELIHSNSTKKLAALGREHIICGVGVCGTGEGNIENDYYGVLKDIVQLEYVGEPLKRCVLFSCEWFDPTLNHGT